MPVRGLERSLRVLLVGTVSCLALACIDPADRRPGTWLSGEEVEDPVSDWSFADEHPEIFVQVSTSYWIPHSVTIVCTTLNGELVVGARNPDSKRWPSYVDRDPNVRLKIGDRIYDQRLEPVEDPEIREAIVRAYAAKYGRPVVPPEDRTPIRYWRVVERRS